MKQSVRGSMKAPARFFCKKLLQYPWIARLSNYFHEVFLGIEVDLGGSFF